ncbi:MAG: riboflavin synthase [Nitrospinae bacterium]|nr:riboflavin synthase [Nitrospinota bacterium]
MFTGIIQATGTVGSIAFSGGAAKLGISAPAGFWEGVNLGDSIATDGVCLTAKEFKGPTTYFDVSQETIDRSIINTYKPNMQVNLEKALAVGDRLGGHFVQGHVDGVGRFEGKRPLGEYVEMDFTIPKELGKYAVEKGSIAINGISLTVAKIHENRITIALIPHTMTVTNLSALTASSPVNIECDIIAKYTEKLLFAGKAQSGIDSDFLKEKGFL